MHILQSDRNGGDRTTRAPSIAKAGLCINYLHVGGRDGRQDITHPTCVVRRGISAGCATAAKNERIHCRMAKRVWCHVGASADTGTGFGASVTSDLERRHWLSG